MNGDTAESRLFSVSRFAAQLARRDPQLVADVLAQPAGRIVLPEPALLLPEQLDEREAKAALRKNRHRVITDVIWRDLDGTQDLVTGANTLSKLADTSVLATLNWLRADMRDRFGEPLYPDGRPMQLDVLAMGKLGGMELNLSSDIDLILLYPQDGETVGGKAAISHQEYFIRQGKRLATLLQDATEDGFAFRVDLRLRPFGEAGQLAVSRNAFTRYLESHAREWERYAAVKARPMDADPDVTEMLSRFSFRRYIDFGVIESLREMKARINDEQDRYVAANDIKRGRGGIREIEFVAQTHQLIHGGQVPALRTRNCLEALQASIEAGTLSSAAQADLAEAYIFLRTLEHRIQAIDDAQTHSLPEDDDRRGCIEAAYDRDWPVLMEELEEQREKVRYHFDELLTQPREVSEVGRAAVAFVRCGSDEPALASALAASCADVDWTDAMATFRRYIAGKNLSEVAWSRLERLLPLLLEALEAVEHPVPTFERLVPLLVAVCRRSAYLALLSENPVALTQLVNLAAASPWIAAALAQHPAQLNVFLDPNRFGPQSRTGLREQLAERLAETEELDQAMDRIRDFTNLEKMRVAAADVSGRLPVARVSDQLSMVAEVALEQALEVGMRDLVARHGEPRCTDDDGTQRQPGFAIIAYGKLGGIELSYASDLDLVFLHDSSGRAQHTAGEKSVDNSVFFTRLGQRIVHILQTLTGCGRAYELDLRLRPGGQSGLPVVSLQAFQNYQRDKAWTWEHQALIRARGITGDADTLTGFEGIRRDTLGQRRDPCVLREEVADMRRRMHQEKDRSDAERFDLKAGLGGITDIEFMVQYLVLRYASESAELARWTDNLRLLASLRDAGRIDEASRSDLHDAYFDYRAAVHQQALQERPAIVPASRFTQQREAVTARWREIMCDANQPHHKP